MITNLLEAETFLAPSGLHVSPKSDFLLIAASFQGDDEEIPVSHDACVLVSEPQGPKLILPGEGMTTREIVGPMSDLVFLVEKIYQTYREKNGTFNDAVAAVLGPMPRTLTGVEARHVSSIPLTPVPSL